MVCGFGTHLGLSHWIALSLFLFLRSLVDRSLTNIFHVMNLHEYVLRNGNTVINSPKIEAKKKNPTKLELRCSPKGHFN